MVWKKVWKLKVWNKKKKWVTMCKIIDESLVVKMEKVEIKM